MVSAVTEKERPNRRALLVGMLGGPLAWSLQFVVAWALVSIVCRSAVLGFELLGMPAVVVLVLAVSVGALLATLYAWGLAYRQFRLVIGKDEVDSKRVESRTRFAALSGIMLSALFALLIVLTGIPAIFLDPCG